MALFAVLLMTVATASAQVTSEVLRDFTACDANFFRSLGRTTPQNDQPRLERKGELAWFKVKDRYDDEGNQAKFSVPLIVAGLKLTSYFDEISDLDALGKYFNWGFIAEGSLNDVAEKMKPFISNANRLRHGDNDYHRTDLKIGKSAWITADLSSGTVPAPLTVERIFVLEPGDDSNTVRITCSLQGSVSGEMLGQERPDIDAADYPATPAPVSAVDGALRSDVVKKIDAVAPPDSVWRPHFRKVSYTKEYLGSKHPFSMSEQIEVRDGLLYSTELYSHNFSMERVSLAGLVQLRSNQSGHNHDVYLTTELTVSLPQTLAMGETLTVSSQAQKIYSERGGKVNRDAFSCNIIGTIPASRIYPSLTGAATLFSCQYPNSRGMQELALLEDLGLTVTTKTESAEDGISVVHYTSFDVTK